MNGSVHDPNDAVGRLLFNVLAMVAEFEADLIRMRTREGMKVAKAKGRLRGKQPKLSQTSSRTSCCFTTKAPTTRPNSPTCSVSHGQPSTELLSIPRASRHRLTDLDPGDASPTGAAH
jgi:hypothetical protein